MNAIDLIGRKFGRLKVVSRAPNGIHYKTRWNCVCECGGVTVSDGANLKSGGATSCGCKFKEWSRGYFTKHGHCTGRVSTTYTIWLGMKARCYKPNNPRYKDYGGRGIGICARWFFFPNFLHDMGERPKNRSIDRINNDWSYMPSNCRWATRKEQQNNTRKSIKYAVLS